MCSNASLGANIDPVRSTKSFDVQYGQVIEHVARPAPAPDPTLLKYLWWVNNYVHSNPGFHVHYHMWTRSTIATILHTRVYSFRHDSAMGSRMDPIEPPDDVFWFKLDYVENDNDDVVMVYKQVERIEDCVSEGRGVLGFNRLLVLSDDLVMQDRSRCLDRRSGMRARNPSSQIPTYAPEIGFTISADQGLFLVMSDSYP
jgi:hypothetical protein